MLPAGRSWDGICGLAWAGLARAGGKTFYQHFQDQGQEAIFSLVPTGHGEAYLALGNLPQDAYKPDTLVWTKAQPLDHATGMKAGDHSFWVASGGLAINKKEPAPVRFLIDTGTNQALMVPPKYYQSIVNSLLPHDTFSRLCASTLAAARSHSASLNSSPRSQWRTPRPCAALPKTGASCRSGRTPWQAARLALWVGSLVASLAASPASRTAHPRPSAQTRLGPAAPSAASLAG